MITYSEPLELNLPDLLATQALASALAVHLKPGLTIYLQGDLGAGKTSLVRGVLTALGHQTSAKSPTYTLVEMYSLDGMDLYHFDLYRLADPEELEFMGIRDYMLQNALRIFEWPEKGYGQIPEPDLVIRLEIHATSRRAVIQATSVAGRQVLHELMQGPHAG